MGLAEGVSMKTAFMAQLLFTVVTIVWAGISSYIVVNIVQAIFGLRVDE